ncbi:hypothetical protein LCGC14_1218070 [marine sediment metagenome]|uniref:Uncharacterized protein n=1 Tax=marine sediment metagenome TaxID=412755 RepID=A0A0F9PGN3_9ZZZZ
MIVGATILGILIGAVVGLLAGLESVEAANRKREGRANRTREEIHDDVLLDIWCPNPPRQGSFAKRKETDHA